MTDINTSLLIEMRALAREANGLSDAPKSADTGFGTLLKDMVDNVNEAQHKSAEIQRDFTLEKDGVSLVDAMLAMQEARLHFQSMVQVRNHLVQAYEEIMRMPV